VSRACWPAHARAAGAGLLPLALRAAARCLPRAPRLRRLDRECLGYRTASPSFISSRSLPTCLQEQQQRQTKKSAQKLSKLGSQITLSILSRFKRNFSLIKLKDTALHGKFKRKEKLEVLGEGFDRRPSRLYHIYPSTEITQEIRTKLQQKNEE
jgi:hypothetical protein